MSTFIRSALGAVILSTLLACGGGGGGGGKTPNPPAPPNMTGNWNIAAQSTVFGGSPAYVAGYLTHSGTNITGTVHVLGSTCFQELTNIAVTGTSNGTQVTVTSAAVDSQVISMTATLSSDGKTITAGTYTITGGCANGDRGTVTGNAMPSLTGNFAGSFRSTPYSSTQQVTASLTQGSTPDANGFLPLTGTVTFTNGQCFTSGSIAAGSGFVVGAFHIATINTNNGQVLVYGQANNTATSINVEYEVESGGCYGDYGTGTLTRQ